MAELGIDDGPQPSKKARRDCKYNPGWKSLGMSGSTRGPTFTRCDVCYTDFNIAYGGLSTVKKYIATSKHMEMEKLAGSNTSVTAFFKANNSFEDSVTRSEVLFASFVAEHNLSFSVANHFTHLTSSMFPDSKIATKFSSARTKTTCIVKGALHPHFTAPVEKMCREGPFSILCDEGNGTDNKHFAILVRFWDERVSMPSTRFLDMPIIM